MRVSHVDVGLSLKASGAGTTRHPPAPLNFGDRIARGATERPKANSFVFNSNCFAQGSPRCVARPQRGSVAACVARCRIRLRSLTHAESTTCAGLRSAGELIILHRRTKSENYCVILCNYCTRAPLAWMTRCLVSNSRNLYTLYFVGVTCLSHYLSRPDVTSQVD